MGSMYRATDYNVPLTSTPSGPCDAAINAYFSTLAGYNKPVIAYFPAGNYYVANLLSFMTSRSLAGIYCATGAKFWLTATVPTGVFQFGNGTTAVTDLLIDGLVVDGNCAGIVTSSTGGAAAVFGTGLYRATFRDCAVLNTWNSGMEFNHCTGIRLRGITTDTTGYVRKFQGGSVSAGANALVVSWGTPVGYPPLFVQVSDCVSRYIGDMGLGIEGNGNQNVQVNNVTVTDLVPGSTVGGTGIQMEVEQFDVGDNSRAQVSNFMAKNVATGVLLHNTTSSYTERDITFMNTHVYDCTTGFELEGNGIQVIGGVLSNVSQGVSSSAAGSGTVRTFQDWTISDLEIICNNDTSVYQPAAFSFVVGPSVTINDVHVSNCIARGSSPTQPGGTNTAWGHAGVFSIPAGFAGGRMPRLKFTNCRFTGFNWGGNLALPDPTEFDGCYFLDNYSAGLNLDGSGPVYVHGGMNNHATPYTSTPAHSSLGAINATTKYVGFGATAPGT